MTVPTTAVRKGPDVLRPAHLQAPGVPDGWALVDVAQAFAAGSDCPRIPVSPHPEPLAGAAT
ncbi:hypothetical protein [Kineococcus sp. SYSU DK018]|uniref:hypothetical protein n=1 Tax=Kineococcus sp. SYSU DK018 TaxID=3383139 RepID=UPI003D7DD235